MDFDEMLSEVQGYVGEPVGVALIVGRDEDQTRSQMFGVLSVGVDVAEERSAS
jgi:hypothetical protein